MSSTPRPRERLPSSPTRTCGWPTCGGLDRSEADLHGASRHEARISGVFSPANLAPEEIRLSVLLGTRMRTRAADRVPS